MKLSIIITAKDKKARNLLDLLDSIDKQDYPKKDYEVLVIDEGTAESAKAIGLKRAKGDIVAIMASDNYLPDPSYLKKMMKPMDEHEYLTGAFTAFYAWEGQTDMLNRYFALFGVNDPIPLYLGKNDRQPYYIDLLYGKIPTFLADGNYGKIIYKFKDTVPTLGDNGYFVRRELLLKADIEHYFHIDVTQDLLNMGYGEYAVVFNTAIAHRTGGNIIKFFKKRLKYADQFSKGRRWHMIDDTKDILKLFWFVISTLTLVYPLYLSTKGYIRFKDRAWFLHLPVCLITIGVYGIWVIKSVLSYVRGAVRGSLKGA